MRVALLRLCEDHLDAPAPIAVLRQALTNGAVAAVEALGWEYTVVASGDLPVSASVSVALEADVVVLLGGADVHPAFYGGALDYPGRDAWDLRADAAHLAVAAACLEEGKPLLGICRGLHIVNVALGGPLIQDLEIPGHRLPTPGLKSFATTHPHFVGQSGLAADVADEPTLCSHHQAVHRLGRGLIVAAESDHGVVEAVVHESARITGVQWHPEHPDVALTQMVPLLRRLGRQAGAAR
jgi:putative glutamine amidotransferase